MSSLAEFLATCSWFNTLTQIQRQQVEDEVYERQYPAGSFVCRTNEIADAWIGVIEGLAVLTNERCGQFIGMVEADRVGGVQARVAQCLASLFNPVLYPRVGLCIDLSQEEIGFLCGLSRQSVNRALQVLEREGLLRREFRTVTVLDVEKLGRFIRAQY